jgi:hypothetical protein
LAVISYPRHFAILGCVAALWIPFATVLDGVDADRLGVLGPTIALCILALVGASHAVSVVAALTAPVSVAKRAVFVVAAATLCVIVSLIAVAAEGRLLKTWGRAYWELIFDSTLPLAAAVGAVTYGLLLKALLVPGLRLRVLWLAAFLCPVATWIAEKSVEHFPVLNQRGWGLNWGIYAWWLAFSTSLILTQRRPMAADNRSERTPASARS